MTHITLSAMANQKIGLSNSLIDNKVLTDISKLSMRLPMIASARNGHPDCGKMV